MEYNADCTGEKYREIARAMGVKGVDDMSVEEYRKAAVDAVQKLSVDVGIPTKLEALKEKTLISLRNLLMQMHVLRVTRKMPVWKILRIFSGN